MDKDNRVRHSENIWNRSVLRKIRFNELSIDKRDEENVDFDEFLNAIQTVLTFENFFDELDGLFRHLDYQKQGKIKIRDLVDSCAKLTSSEIAGTHEIRVPSATDIE